MTTVSATDSTTRSNALAKATDTAQQLSDRFMKLLVAQLKNQDPLNPTDNAQFTSQMAQINTLSGINTLNSSVGDLLGHFQQLEQMQAAQLTGRNVLVSGTKLTVQPEGTDAGSGVLKGGFTLAGAADQVSVVVKDAGGDKVRTIHLSQTDGASMQTFTWDGKDDAGNAAKAGDYTYAVEATSAGAAVAASATWASGRVEGVTTTAGGQLALMLAGGRTVAYADVKQIL